MKIKEISIKNFKSLYNLPIKDLTDVNVFIGKNNSGKSNIFESINVFYRNITRTHEEVPILFTEERVKPREVSTEITFLFEIDNLNTELNQSNFDSSLDDYIKELIKHDEKIGKASSLSNLRAWPDYFSFYDIFIGVLECGLLELRTKFKLEHWDTAGYSSFLQNLAESPYPDEIKTSLNSVKYLKIDYSHDDSSGPAYRISLLDSERSELMNLSELSAIPTTPRGHLRFLYWDFDWDFSIVLGYCLFKTIGFDSRFNMEEEKIENVLKKIMTQNPSKLSQIIGEVDKITGSNIQEIKLHEDKLLFSFKDRRGSVPLHNLGLGTQRILQIVSNCLFQDSQRIIFIEEPELHIHPHAQRRLFEFFKNQAGHNQFFINTHSTIFTGQSDKLSTYLVSFSNEETVVTQIKEREELKSVKYEIGAKHTDLYFYDCIVLIEGDTEESAFPIIADALGYDLKEEGIRLINIKGNPNAKKRKIGQFLEFMKISDVIMYLILDGGDKGVNKIVDELVKTGLVEKENYTTWEKTFADCFSETQIIQAMNELSSEFGFKFHLTQKELKQKREEGKLTEKILVESLSDWELDKPELGKRLGLIIKNENITQKTRDKTKPEEVVEKIIQIVRNKTES